MILNVIIVISTSFGGFTRFDDNTKQKVVYHGIFNLQKGKVIFFKFENVASLSYFFQGMAAIFFCFVSHQLIFPLS